MSRWSERFESHPLQESWNELKENLKLATVDDETVVTSVEELARLRKVVAYVDGLLASIDPELIPPNILDSFHQQCVPCNSEIASYNANKNIAHIRNANGNVDNLLSYVKPYMVAGGRTAKALRQAAKAYSDSFEEFAGSFQERASEVLRGLEEGARQASESGEVVGRIAQELSGVHNELLGDEEEDGIYDIVKRHIDKINVCHSEITSLHKELLEGTESDDSIKSQIEEAVENITNAKSAADDLIRDSKKSLKEIGDFHIRVFGTLDEEGNRQGGLSTELDAHVARLDKFEVDQKKRYSTLNQQIESLLPGATSAGLASAYREMKESFTKPILFASLLFYGSIALLVIFSTALSIDSITGGGIKFYHLTDWESVLRSLAYKAPIYAPLVWLAYYSSKRRSEFQRLQQEYAHKEALAKSYDSYKKQIDGLGEDDNTLLKMLISSAIEAISRNASETLDGKHGDKMPLQDAIDLAIDKAAASYLRP